MNVIVTSILCGNLNFRESPKHNFLKKGAHTFSGRATYHIEIKYIKTGND